MHAGFAFLEAGTVGHKNQVNSLVKILVDFAVSTVVYFFIGFSIAYGVNFITNAAILTGKIATENSHSCHWWMVGLGRGYIIGGKARALP